MMWHRAHGVYLKPKQMTDQHRPAGKFCRVMEFVMRKGVRPSIIFQKAFFTVSPQNTNWSDRSLESMGDPNYCVYRIDLDIEEFIRLHRDTWKEDKRVSITSQNSTVQRMVATWVVPGLVFFNPEDGKMYTFTVMQAVEACRGVFCVCSTMPTLN